MAAGIALAEVSGDADARPGAWWPPVVLIATSSECQFSRSPKSLRSLN